MGPKRLPKTDAADTSAEEQGDAGVAVPGDPADLDPVEHPTG
jgi:hypothetical protein